MEVIQRSWKPDLQQRRVSLGLLRQAESTFKARSESLGAETPSHSCPSHHRTTAPPRP